MTVTLPYDPVWTALAWAKEHCPSYITNESVNTTRLKKVPGGWVADSNIVYFFSDEKDALLFALRWAG
jgi:hypothetical protein